VGTPLPKDRFEAYGAVAHGKVHFIGGITGVFGDIATAEPSRRVDIFDPASGRWDPGPDLPADAPKHHLAVAIWEERIFVVGGFDGIIDQHPNEPFLPIAVAYVLDGAAWKKLAPPPLARGASTAQAIDGKIYVAGGAKNEGIDPEDELDIYDIQADTWTTGAKMPTAREHLASCAIGGKMIVVGGWAGAPKTAQRAAEIYDPKTNVWSALAPLPTPRGGLGATARGTECHVVGGEDWALPFPGTFTTHEVFDTATSAWTTRAPMPTARHGLGLAWLDARLWAVGGGPSMGNSYTTTVEIFAP
jgi:N-acetylneuraminic acid mutarotase